MHIEPDIARNTIADFIIAIDEMDRNWSFYTVEPNFLHSTGYWLEPDDFVMHPLAYFEGSDLDTATFFLGEKSALVLLTCGSG
jgi:hypothetical protein